MRQRKCNRQVLSSEEEWIKGDTPSKQVSPSQQIPGEINGIPFHLQLQKKEQQTTPAKKINRMQKTKQGGGNDEFPAPKVSFTGTRKI
ncbi:hypothetical protein TNIN_191411 [Trichonephila inaurata madagascariensis]|uniref:Uncharacterized protein n=1 Tax=Trichonephila inaurata madagascariensis TaxID=2747483 RepID=A0A8X6I5B7_9ARAC|nr:hypothetical protein TNIN_191411 [Trichonephila inaurata madagascariensis]